MFRTYKSIRSCLCSRNLPLLDGYRSFNLSRCDRCNKKSDSGDKKPGQDGDSSPPCCCEPNHPAYDTRKYGHCIPGDRVLPPFDPLPCIPTGVFRCTHGEILGPGAAKYGYYQNPEYFSFQHMSYYDMHLFLRAYRNSSGTTGRKP